MSTILEMVFSELFKNYRYFYNLHGQNNRNILSKNNLTKLFNQLKTKEKNYTDLMIT